MQYGGEGRTGARKANRAAVLRSLYAQGGLSRKRLSEMVRLTPAAITNISSELIAEGLIREGGIIPGSGAGRREITLMPEPGAYTALGVYLGLGRAVLSGTMLDGSILFAEETAIPRRAPAEETVRSLSEKLLSLAEQNGIRPESVCGLGIAVRGTVSENGRGVHASFDTLDEEDYPLCGRFETYTGFQSVLSGNVRALLGAQLCLDRTASAGSTFFLHCGPGIGAAYAFDGKILTGDSRRFAEIGHIPVVRRGGKICHCGKTGCLETIASPDAILEDALAQCGAEKTPLFYETLQAKGSGAATVYDVLDAARGGDAGAASIADHAAEALADALKSVIYLLDPGRIILYGGIFEHPYFYARLSAEMETGVSASHTIPIEKSRYNGKLENAAACILAAERFLENGGIRG